MSVTVFPGHRSGNEVNSIVPMFNGTFVSSGADGLLYLWDMRNPRKFSHCCSPFAGLKCFGNDDADITEIIAENPCNISTDDGKSTNAAAAAGTSGSSKFSMLTSTVCIAGPAIASVDWRRPRGATWTWVVPSGEDIGCAAFVDASFFPESVLASCAPGRPDGPNSVVAVVDADGELYFLDRATGTPLRFLSLLNGLAISAQPLAESPDDDDRKFEPAFTLACAAAAISVEPDDLGSMRTTKPHKLLAVFGITGRVSVAKFNKNGLLVVDSSDCFVGGFSRPGSEFDDDYEGPKMANPPLVAGVDAFPLLVRRRANDAANSDNIDDDATAAARRPFAVPAFAVARGDGSVAFASVSGYPQDDDDEPAASPQLVFDLETIEGIGLCAVRWVTPPAATSASTAPSSSSSSSRRPVLIAAATNGVITAWKGADKEVAHSLFGVDLAESEREQDDEGEEEESEEGEEEEDDDDDENVTCAGTWSLRDHKFEHTSSGLVGGGGSGSKKKDAAAESIAQHQASAAAQKCMLNAIAVVPDAQGVPMVVTGDSTGRIVAVPFGLIVSS